MRLKYFVYMFVFKQFLPVLKICPPPAAAAVPAAVVPAVAAPLAAAAAPAFAAPAAAPAPPAAAAPAASRVPTLVRILLP